MHSFLSALFVLIYLSLLAVLVGTSWHTLSYFMFFDLRKIYWPPAMSWACSTKCEWWQFIPLKKYASGKPAVWRYCHGSQQVFAYPLSKFTEYLINNNLHLYNILSERVLMVVLSCLIPTPSEINFHCTLLQMRKLKCREKLRDLPWTTARSA